MYLVKLALRPWKESMLSQFLTIFMIGFLLFLICFLFWIELGLDPVIGRLKNDQVVTAYLSSGITSEDESRVMDSIRLSLGSSTVQNVDIEFVGPEGFLSDMEKSYPQLGKQLLDLGGELNSIVPRYVSLTGTVSEAIVDKIRSIPGIESVDHSVDRFQHVIGAFLTLQWLSLVLGVGLCIAMFIGLLHLARTNSQMNRETLNVLRLWGAGPLTLKVPNILSGVIVGFAGGMVAYLVWSFASPWLIEQVRSLSPILVYMALPHPTLELTTVFIGVLVGVLTGLFGETPSKIQRQKSW